MKQLKLKQKNPGFLGMLAVLLGAGLMGNLLAGKAVECKILECKARIPRLRVIRTGEGTIRTAQGFSYHLIL